MADGRHIENRVLAISRRHYWTQQTREKTAGWADTNTAKGWKEPAVLDVTLVASLADSDVDQIIQMAWWRRL